MKAVWIPVVLLVSWTASQPARAMPWLIANKILERPETFALGPIGGMAEAVIEGADEIEEIDPEVGDPAIPLNVLIVKPRDYGLNLTGTTKKNKDGSGTVNFAINVTSETVKHEEYLAILPAERRKMLEGKEDASFQPTPEEMNAMAKLVVQKGSSAVEPKSKTIFFLSGYGISNRSALPWALILAKQGYQVIAVDLPGMAKSGGKGPTFGKREAEDLVDLLSQLRASGRIGADEAVGVIGVSYGAGIAALWSARDPRIAATVLIAPYDQGDDTIVKAADVLAKHLGLPFEVKPEFVRSGMAMAAAKLGISWADLAPAKAIPAIAHPIHFITSPTDDIVPPAVVEELHRSAREGSTLDSIDVPHMFLGLYLEELEPEILSYLEKTLP